MKSILITLLLISFIPSLGQEKHKFQVSFQLQPELTLHQNQYSYRWRDKYTKATFNVGIASEVQYNLTSRFFISVGLGYISRRLNTTVFLDQATLPLPHYSGTKELNNTKYLSYRTLQVPANIGFNFIDNKKLKSFLLAGVSANYLLNAYYQVGNPQYDATYKKGYWQGVSFNGGIGADIHLAKNLFLTSSLSYSFTNPVHSDKFLFSQDDKGIALPHKYLRVSLGIKMPL
jgi:hypothetical protein